MKFTQNTQKERSTGSDKHSDLYTDENPKGTIHGLGFKDVETAKASVKKIESSGKSHAHKIQTRNRYGTESESDGKDEQYRKYSVS